MTDVIASYKHVQYIQYKTRHVQDICTMSDWVVGFQYFLLGIIIIIIVITINIPFVGIQYFQISIFQNTWIWKSGLFTRKSIETIHTL